MKKILEKLNIDKTTNLIKDYASFLLLMASFLGGVKQFITLCFYSPSLLQYFSLSQVLIDGISILIKSIIFILALSIGIITYLVTSQILRTISIIASSICALFFLALTIFPADNPMAHLIFQNLFITSVGVLFGLSYHSGNIGKKRFLFISCFYGLFVIISDHQQGDDILNIENHNIEVNKKYPKAKLLYTNDTYLFYGIPRDPKKEIINSGFLLPPPKENFVICNFYVEKKDVLFEETK
ncbi:MAG: hypothetical protein DI622_05715 [Chryseobacterium sp.]|uniref:hypothetical protein n=1 Tax=Chryseobacterium sp. TaxID=1871047 RepID=UPI000DB38F6D|nr:hypothetical protein [Chryseobacterium sp.]MPS64062.1 hypothetical protein [Chryseobacterium sp.]PZU22583.1 MAG: hypothetical protein DI622_05715 [Chryseobacterium sp.]